MTDEPDGVDAHVDEPSPPQPRATTPPATTPPVDERDDIWHDRWDDDDHVATASPPLQTRRRAAVADDDTRATRRASERRRRRRRRWLVVVLVALLVLVPLAAASGWFVWQLYGPGGPGGETAEVVIEPGWGASEAADALVKAEVIESALAFRIWARVTGASFQAGTYAFPMGVNVTRALNVLEAGPTNSLQAAQQKLLLPPGLTMSRIADRVGQLPGHTRDAFLAVADSGVVRSKYQPAGTSSLEGLTWPDTYFVSEGMTDQQILQMIVSEFDEHADAVGLGAPNGAGLTPYEALVSASLIQGEAAAADQANVSGVIVNRLRRGIPLQIDATLCYAKGGCPPVPTNADKAIDSPYNTYRVTGLPPTPILTVTEPAMRAALNPASHNYLYYVTGKDGVTRFAETLAGHQANIDKYGVRGE